MRQSDDKRFNRNPIDRSIAPDHRQYPHQFAADYILTNITCVGARYFTTYRALNNSHVSEQGDAQSDSKYQTSGVTNVHASSSRGAPAARRAGTSTNTDGEPT